jgi:hypothetical protein
MESFVVAGKSHGDDMPFVGRENDVWLLWKENVGCFMIKARATRFVGQRHVPADA